MAIFSFILFQCSLALTVHGVVFRNSAVEFAPAVKAAELQANIYSASKAQTISSSFSVERSLVTTIWETCTAASGYACLSGQTCCGNTTTANCYLGTDDVCCNYFYACPSSTPVCCSNNGYYCCSSGYTCSSSSTNCIAPPSSSSSSSSKGCFAGFETVKMESGAVKYIKDVVVGDRILSYSVKQNEFVFSLVVALLGRNPDGNTQFFQLWMADGKSLALTADHLVQAGSCETSVTSLSLGLKQAKKVKLGECLATAAGPKKVVAISSVEGKGAFSVVTNHDYVVISGVVASPFSLNHALPDLFYSVHRYLLRHYPQWMKTEASSSSSLQLVAFVLSYFADASRPLLGAL